MTPQRLAEIRQLLTDIEAARARLRQVSSGLGYGQPAPMVRAVTDLLAALDARNADVERLYEFVRMIQLVVASRPRYTDTLADHNALRDVAVALEHVREFVM